MLVFFLIFFFCRGVKSLTAASHVESDPLSLGLRSGSWTLVGPAQPEDMSLFRNSSSMNTI